MKFFKSEKNHISEEIIKTEIKPKKHRIFKNIENNPSKFKYINFRDIFWLIITGGT